MRKVIIIALLVTSCTSQVKPQASITPSSLPVPTITTASNKIAKYPPEAIANYIDVCTKGGVSKKSCGCFIEKAQNVYPLDELIKINNSGTETPAKIKEMLSTCDDKPKASVVKASVAPTLAPATKIANTKTTPQNLAPIVSTTPTFPDWLIKDDHSASESRETDFKIIGKDGTWAYDNRFTKSFSKWPYTASATNHSELTYIDCWSGWEYYKNHPFIVEDRYSIATPPTQEYSFQTAAQRLERLRESCNQMGISPRF
jgi:hypothetical protein